MQALGPLTLPPRSKDQAAPFADPRLHPPVPRAPYAAAQHLGAGLSQQSPRGHGEAEEGGPRRRRRSATGPAGSVAAPRGWKRLLPVGDHFLQVLPLKRSGHHSRSPESEFRLLTSPLLRVKTDSSLEEWRLLNAPSSPPRPEEIKWKGQK